MRAGREALFADAGDDLGEFGCRIRARGVRRVAGRVIAASVGAGRLPQPPRPAAAVAAMARHLGLGKLCLAGTTPHLSCVVDALPDRSLGALTAYATVAFGAPTTVLPLAAVPPARRAALWASAPVVAPPADASPADPPLGTPDAGAS